MTRPLFNIAALIVVCALIMLATIGNETVSSPIIWIIIALISVGVFLVDITDTSKSVKKFMNLGKEPESVRIDNLMNNGELVILSLDDCRIKDTASEHIVEKVDSSADSTNNVFQADTTNINKRYISYERIYDGIKYEFKSSSTHYSVKHLQMLLSSTQAFKLYIDQSNPRNYYFETPI